MAGTNTHPGYAATTAATAAWRKKILGGDCVYIGCSVNSSSTLVAELVASLGYDFVLVDNQHSAIDTENLRYLLTAVKAGGSRSIVRVGGHMDRIGIQQALDLGATGILIPCARTVEDIQYAVSCAKYPTNGPGSDNGSRSIFVNLRNQFPGGFGTLIPSATKDGNEETFIACQIETKDALENVEGIAAIDGLDCCFIGPGDLAADMVRPKIEQNLVNYDL